MPAFLFLFRFLLKEKEVNSQEIFGSVESPEGDPQISQTGFPPFGRI